MRPQCVGCLRPIQAQQPRLTLSRDAGGGGHHTSGVFVHLSCWQISERIQAWAHDHRYELGAVTASKAD